MGQFRKVGVVGIFLAIGVLLAITVGTALAAPGNPNAQGNGPGCVAGGKGYVGPLPGSANTNGIPVQLNWHGSFVFSLCGGTGPQDGDWDIQHFTYPDGTTENYKVVFSTDDLTPNGVFCYMDLHTGEYHPKDCSAGDLYWYIVSSSGDSPYLEPAASGGTKSTPNGFGRYK